MSDSSFPPAPSGRGIEIRPLRLVVAGVLLSGLFALLFFVFLRDGAGADSAEPAELVQGPPTAAAGIHPGDVARDFEASDLEEERFRLSTLRGGPVVINFWATWCGSCAAEMPVLEEQRRAHEADGLNIVAVNVGEDLGDASDFVDEFGLQRFAIAMDPDLTIADAFGIRGLPHSLFIDAEGVIQAEYQGQLDDDTMERYIQAALEAVPGGEPPERLRIVTTVPRENVLDVAASDDAPGEVVFRSRRFRCDDDYCAEPIAEQVRELAGVQEVALRGESASPSLAVTFSAGTLSLDLLVVAVVDALAEHPDPLYTRDLDIRFD